MVRYKYKALYEAEKKKNQELLEEVRGWQQTAQNYRRVMDIMTEPWYTFLWSSVKDMFGVKKADVHGEAKTI